MVKKTKTIYESKMMSLFLYFGLCYYTLMRNLNSSEMSL